MPSFFTAPLTGSPLLFPAVCVSCLETVAAVQLGGIFFFFLLVWLSVGGWKVTRSAYGWDALQVLCWHFDVWTKVIWLVLLVNCEQTIFTGNRLCQFIEVISWNTNRFWFVVPLWLNNQIFIQFPKLKHKKTLYRAQGVTHCNTWTALQSRHLNCVFLGFSVHCFDLMTCSFNV